MVRLLLLALAVFTTAVSANPSREVRNACRDASDSAEHHLAREYARAYQMYHDRHITKEQLDALGRSLYTTQDNRIRIGRAVFDGTVAECQGEAEIQKELTDKYMKELTQ